MRDSFLFFNFSVTRKTDWVGERSVREFVSRHGPGQTMYTTQSARQELAEVVRRIRVKGLLSLLNKGQELIEKRNTAFGDYLRSLKDCGLPPTAFSLIESIPVFQVLDRNQDLIKQAVIDLEGTNEEYALSLDESLSIGADLVVPDPDYIMSERKSRLIIKQNAKTLATLLCAFEDPLIIIDDDDQDTCIEDDEDSEPDSLFQGLYDEEPDWSAM